MTKQKTKKNVSELDKKCQAALQRVNKHIDKLVARHLKEMALVVADNKK